MYSLLSVTSYGIIPLLFPPIIITIIPYYVLSRIIIIIIIIIINISGHLCIVQADH